MSAEWEVQKAIFAKLGADLAVPVFDFVPQENAPSNYITIGADTLAPFSTDNKNGFDGTLVIHSWAVANGRKTIKALQGAVYDSLSRADLVVTGYNSIGIDFEFSETNLDPDGVTYHGVQRFRILMMEQ